MNLDSMHLTFVKNAFRRCTLPLEFLILTVISVHSSSAQSLLNHYTLDQSTLAFDGSSNVVGASAEAGNNLGLIGGDFPAEDSGGRFGEAINFTNGRLDTIVFRDGSTPLGNNFTYSFWVKVPDVTSQTFSYLTMIGEMVTGAGQQNAILYGFESGRFELYTNTFTGTNPQTASHIQLTSDAINTWTHIAYTYDGATLNGYVNGAEAFSNNIVFSLTGTGGMSIGGSRNPSDPFKNFFQGSVDDFAIFDAALTPEQIAFLSQNSVSAIPEPSSFALISSLLALTFSLMRRRK